MEVQDVLKLLDSDFATRVEEYIGVGVHEVALKTGDKDFATALKYLQKAKLKMPSWYAARCILTQELFEQSTSEAVAVAKFQGFATGGRVLDLTCGLGVDSAVMSRHFDSVTTIEIDPVKARLAHHNFGALGLSNIEVVNSSAEQYCQSVLGSQECFDMVYVDPSRIKGDKRVFSLEDSSPNILMMLDDLLTLSPRVVIKLSPLFDVEELYSVFANYELGITVISKDNECREVLAEVSSKSLLVGGKNPINVLVINSNETNSYALEPNFDRAAISHQTFAPRFLCRPDVAFYKARLVSEYFLKTLGVEDFIYDNYVFTSAEMPQSIEGHSFKIDAFMPYNPKAVRAELQKRGIKSAEISIRNFPHSLAQIRTKLKLPAGSDARLFFTTYCAKPTVFFVT